MSLILAGTPVADLEAVEANRLSGPEQRSHLREMHTARALRRRPADRLPGRPFLSVQRIGARQERVRLGPLSEAWCGREKRRRCSVHTTSSPHRTAVGTSQGGS